MKNIYELKHINEFTYSLKIYGEYNLILIQTIKKMLKSSYYDEDTTSIIFLAENVIDFKENLLNYPENKLPYKHCLKMIDDLTKQIIYLKTINYGFYGFDIEDILKIDNTYIFCNTQYLMSLTNDAFVFMSPIKRPYFSNPDIIELTTLPSEISHNCSYYSFGSLIVLCLLGKYLLVGNEIKSQEYIDNILYPLNNTKIYWFLKRCLEEKIDKRVLLLI